MESTYTSLATATVVAACLAAIGCAGQEGGSDVDAMADAHAHAEGGTCTAGAPCAVGDSCELPCSGGYRGRLYCSDGTWQAGLGLFPCSDFDAASDTNVTFDTADRRDAADAPTCSIGDALVSDASCTAMDAGCADGAVCAVEIGGPMRRGATWCVTIPPECGGVPTCACMGVCACGSWRCVDGTAAGEILCDDGTI
jgi:hypothetical protein